MPKLSELREIDGVLWARIDGVQQFPSGIALWTPEEVKGYRRNVLGVCAAHILKAPLDGCAEFRDRVADEILDL